MIAMKCSYCQGELGKGSGIMYVYKTGNIAYYCCSKCYKNDIVLKRRISKKNLKNTVTAKKAAK